MAHSSEGNVLALGHNDRAAKLWNTEAGEVLTPLEGHSRWVSSVALSSDGKVLATTSYDNTAKLWHAETGEVLTTLKGHSRG